MDILDDVLGNLRLHGQLYFRTELRGAWGVAIPADRATIRFHLVVQGQCFAAVEPGGRAQPLAEGDFVLIPHGAAQTLRNAPETATVSLQDLLGAGGLPADGVLRHGDAAAGGPVRLVCGFFDFDEGNHHPLFPGLPDMLVLRRPQAGDSPWLADAVRLLTIESERGAMGAAAVLCRLMEVLFIQGIRHHMDSGAQPAIPFLVALQEPRLRRALEAMHRDPGADWTLTRLAATAGMSRGRFATKFREALGEPPMTYLTNWRLQKARRLLRETDLSIAEVAFRAGYQSLPSFTRRFGRQFGISPGAFRRRG